jgi:hypothetical protein
MSTLLDAALDDERRLVFATNDAAMQPRQLRAFRILIGQRGAPRLSFEAMGYGSCDVVAQHIDLTMPGERCEVVPLDRSTP